jgi:hypothetical protein
MTNTDREKLLTRIRALFAKTTETGATEAEELAAAEKARELIEKYQIDLGAEELKRDGFVKKAIDMETVHFTFARFILDAIDKFCEVRCWYTTFGSPQIVVFGLASDVELAAYLIESLVWSVLCQALYTLFFWPIPTGCVAPCERASGSAVTSAALGARCGHLRALVSGQRQNQRIITRQFHHAQQSTATI